MNSGITQPESKARKRILSRASDADGTTWVSNPKERLKVILLRSPSS